jgi:ligand-binding sensor domain-containing protein
VSLHADHAGGLWVRGQHEIFYQKGGVVTSHFALEGQYRTENVSVDPDGSLWVLHLGYDVREPLCHVTVQGVKCFGESDGLLLIPYGGESLLADGKGGFWLGGQRAVVHWHEGASEVYPIEALKSQIGDAVAALAFDAEGSLWVGILLEGPGKGLGRLERGVFKPFVTPGFDGSKLAIFAMALDR